MTPFPDQFGQLSERVYFAAEGGLSMGWGRALLRLLELGEHSEFLAHWGGKAIEWLFGPGALLGLATAIWAAIKGWDSLWIAIAAAISFGVGVFIAGMIFFLRNQFLKWRSHIPEAVEEQASVKRPDLEVFAISVSAWMSPNDAFYKYGNQDALHHYADLMRRSLDAERNLKQAQKDIEQRRRKWYAKFGRNTSGLTLPSPPKDKELMERIEEALNRHNEIVAARNQVYREAKNDFTKKLQRGELRARGFRPPKTTGDTPVHINPDEWYGLELDEVWNAHNLGRTGGRETIAYIHLTIAKSVRKDGNSG